MIGFFSMKMLPTGKDISMHSDNRSWEGLNTYMEVQMEFPRIITSGDTAIVVEFEDKIDPEINAKVKAFYEVL